MNSFIYLINQPLSINLCQNLDCSIGKSDSYTRPVIYTTANRFPYAYPYVYNPLFTSMGLWNLVGSLLDWLNHRLPFPEMSLVCKMGIITVFDLLKLF